MNPRPPKKPEPAKQSKRDAAVKLKPLKSHDAYATST